jgi:type IV secretory pathway VirB10-like protein
MADVSTNQWKLATIGLLIVGATVLITSLVIGRDAKIVPPEEMVQAKEVDTQVAKKEPVNKPKAAVKIAATPPPAPKPVYSPQPTHPPQSIVQACNKYASDQVNSKTEEVVKDAMIGAAIGAAVGAAGGAIAGGGKGAGKGAGIGAVAGGAGGTLYGLNENQTNDARYQEAYSSCMRSRGYYS